MDRMALCGSDAAWCQEILCSLSPYIQDGADALTAPPGTACAEDTQRDVSGLEERPGRCEYRDGGHGHDEAERDGVVQAYV
jgi:hypothetical protein